MYTAEGSELFSGLLLLKEEEEEEEVCLFVCLFVCLSAKVSYYSPAEYYQQFYLQSIEDVDGYVREKPCKTSVEKEHVLVALHVKVAGRPGILLLDPGYHIARVITVMADNLYPHTGEHILLPFILCLFE
jgi:hypothetical protein